MTPVGFSQLLLLLTWFMLAALLWLMALVGRFYTKFSGEPTYYRWFALPIVGFGIAAVRYSSMDRIGGDVPADSLMALSGIVLAVISLTLYRQMTSQKTPS